MFKVSKEFSFDMAHLLDGHDGKCQNLHGHTYKLQVEVCGNLYASGAKQGMVIDFSDLKSIVKRAVLDPMDHAFIYDQTSGKQNCHIVTTARFQNLWCTVSHNGRAAGAVYLSSFERRRKSAGFCHPFMGNPNVIL